MRGRGQLTALLACCAGAVGLAAPASASELYVANRGSDDVSVVDSDTNAASGAPIAVGVDPISIAITPDGTRAYVSNSAGTVSVIDTATRTTVGEPIPIGFSTFGIAMAPDGSRAYVVRLGNPGRVYEIDTATNTVVGPPIEVGNEPIALAITPDGSRAYVTNSTGGNVSVIDLATRTVIGSPIGPINSARGIAITPDGSRAYVVSNSANEVSVIDLQTNSLVGTPIHGPNLWVAITPDGARAVGTSSNPTSENVFALDLETNQPIGTAATVPGFLQGVAITPDGSRAYVAADGLMGAFDNVTAVDTETNQVVGGPVDVGSDPENLAAVPNQPPAPEIEVRAKGRKLTVDASGSTDPEGEIVSFGWEFGDGSAAETPAAKHTYTKPGRRTVSLTVDDGEGCPGFVYTGQTALCNGPSTTGAEVVVAAIELGKLKRKPRAGTAKLTVKAPGPGKLKVGGKGVRKDRARVRAGKRSARLVVEASGAKARLLERTGAVKLKLKVSFRPQGGVPNKLKTKARLMASR